MNQPGGTLPQCFGPDPEDGLMISTWSEQCPPRWNGSFGRCDHWRRGFPEAKRGARLTTRRAGRAYRASCWTGTSPSLTRCDAPGLGTKPNASELKSAWCFRVYGSRSSQRVSPTRCQRVLLCFPRKARRFRAEKLETNQWLRHTPL